MIYKSSNVRNTEHLESLSRCIITSLITLFQFVVSNTLQTLASLLCINIIYRMISFLKFLTSSLCGNTMEFNSIFSDAKFTLEPAIKLTLVKIANIFVNLSISIYISIALFRGIKEKWQLTQNGDGRIELSIGVEQWQIVHFGKRFVRVWVAWSALDSGPLAHVTAFADDAVQNYRVCLNLCISQNDGLADSHSRTNDDASPYAHIGTQLK